MKILIISDAWKPQVNGVVRTLSKLQPELEALSHEVLLLTPDQFRTIPAPSYPEIRLALVPGRQVARTIEAVRPDAIHLATEGPLGWAGWRYCRRHGVPFTTSYTTQFPEYLHKRWRVPLSWSYAVLRRFHNGSAGTLVATASMRRALEQWGFRVLREWTRGVDRKLFKPTDKHLLDFPRPIYLSAGRVATEKNLEAFLGLELEGTKVVVGAGPELARLRAKYPDARFLGYRENGELAGAYASADVFVFPSRTDTFGLVMLEALASGVPVAAYPVPGPLDVIGDSGPGVLDEDLGKAVREALKIPAATCRKYALRFTWRRCAEMFVQNLQPVQWAAELSGEFTPAVVKR